MPEVAIRMPKMSMTMTDGEVLSWSVHPGDEVQAGDVVCEVMTDKVDMEVESPSSGTITRIVVESGVAPVGEPIAWLQTEDDEGLGDLLGAEPEPAEAGETSAQVGADEEPEPARAEADEEPEPARADVRPDRSDEASGAPGGHRAPVAAIPRARALAREHGVDLASVASSRSDGVVAYSDVEPATRPTQPASRPAAGPGPQPGRARPAATGRAAAIRAVARRMTQSAAVPQFTVWRDLDLDRADARRAGISWTTVMLQAYARALQDVPRLLTAWDGAAPVDTGAPAVGVAVAAADGLVVPVFLDPAARDPRELDADVRRTVDLARRGRIDQEHLVPANATLSNLGSAGVDSFQALVTPPQASVLALGRAVRRPAAIPGGLGLVLSLTTGLTVDHRVADGADGAAALAAIAAHLG